MGTICLVPIGVIPTPLRQLGGVPIQAVAAQGVEGRIVLEPAYAPGLRDGAFNRSPAARRRGNAPHRCCGYA